MCNYFRICLARKFIPLCLEIAANLFIILDDAVMNDCYVTTRDMRMSITYLGRTMSRPSCMSNTYRTRYIIFTNTFEEILNTRDCTYSFNNPIN